MSIENKLTAIDPSKKCLEFLAKRIASNYYRGIQLSQHNRYDVDIIVTLLDEMHKLVGKKAMIIRNTDLSKRPYNYPDEITYAQYTTNVNEKISRCTQDSIRKNLFVDMHRMGFIKRFDRDGHELAPYERGNIKAVCLSELGLDLVNNKNNEFTKNLIYTNAIDRLTNGLADELLEIVAENKKITDIEFMFFMSFMGFKICEHTYDKQELLNYMLQFRSMSKYQQDAVIRVVEEYCIPSKFGGNKLNKRDFHNWKNEAQQIFMLMGQTVYFENRGNELSIRIGDAGLFDDEAKLSRSIKEKELYFKKHNVSRTIGFELHHIIPLLSARSKEEFSTLDVWKNMIYIDGYTHAIISQTQNRNISLEFVGENIELIDPSGINEIINCKKDQSVLYGVDNQATMKAYNIGIINHLN